MPAAALIIRASPALRRQLPPDTSVPVFPPYAWALLCPFGLSRMCCFPPHAWAHGRSAALSILPSPRQKRYIPRGDARRAAHIKAVSRMHILYHDRQVENVGASVIYGDRQRGMIRRYCISQAAKRRRLVALNVVFYNGHGQILLFCDAVDRYERHCYRLCPFCGAERAACPAAAERELCLSANLSHCGIYGNDLAQSIIFCKCRKLFEAAAVSLYRRYSVERQRP